MGIGHTWHLQLHTLSEAEKSQLILLWRVQQGSGESHPRISLSSIEKKILLKGFLPDKARSLESTQSLQGTVICLRQSDWLQQIRVCYLLSSSTRQVTWTKLQTCVKMLQKVPLIHQFEAQNTLDPLLFVVQQSSINLFVDFSQDCNSKLFSENLLNCFSQNISKILE